MTTTSYQRGAPVKNVALPVESSLAIVASALRRGDLEANPHHKPAVVQKLREASARLQAVAVELLNLSIDLNDANTVYAVRKAGDEAAEALARIVAQELSGNGI